VTFQTVAELLVNEHRGAAVYAEGWQTWSPMRLYRFGEASERAADERSQVVTFRPGKPVPEGMIQAEGLLAVAPVGGPARAWLAPDPAHDVATIRLTPRGEVSADGPVQELEAADLAGVLAAAGDRLGAGPTRAIPAGWCSWSYYFKQVTEADVVENAEAARRLELPLEIVQVDDGYETEIGDWLDLRPGFGSLERLGQRLAAVGMRAGIWIPPFMVSPTSALATRHPDWLVRGADAGMHWGQRMRILDITNPAAADYLAHVLQTFTGWGYSYFKLDFLYAAAIPGIDVYRRGMQLVREAVGPDAIILIGGAPLLPSIGLCDAMRVGPDVLPEEPEPQLDLDAVVRITALRSWMNRRLWANDPDCLVARPAIREREAWAAHVQRYGGVRFSSDRLAALDARGLDLTRRFLSQAEHRQ
jgi:alpha-galactosidase